EGSGAMKGHGQKMGRKMEAAIAALLSEPSLETAAAKAGVSPRSLGNWMHQADFLAAFHAARMAVLSAGITQLVNATTQAVSVLVAELTGLRAADRIRAATAILVHANQGIEIADLSADLAELRRQVEEVSRGRTPASVHARNGAPDAKDGPGDPRQHR